MTTQPETPASELRARAEERDRGERSRGLTTPCVHCGTTWERHSSVGSWCPSDAAGPVPGAPYHWLDTAFTSAAEIKVGSRVRVNASRPYLSGVDGRVDARAGKQWIVVFGDGAHYGTRLFSADELELLPDQPSEQAAPTAGLMIHNCAVAIAAGYVPAFERAGVEYNPTNSVATIEEWITRCADRAVAEENARLKEEHATAQKRLDALTAQRDEAVFANTKLALDNLSVLKERDEALAALEKIRARTNGKSFGMGADIYDACQRILARETAKREGWEREIDRRS